MTGESVRKAVRDLLPAIGERAQETDDGRAVAPGTVRDLAAAGVFRTLQPRRYGGEEGDPVEFFRLVRELAAVCGSTGWVVSVLGVHPWQLGLFEDRAQAEVWGEDADTLVCSAYAPTGRLTPDGGGGYRLSGRWRFSSGCAHASWALLGALVVGSEGHPVDFLTVLVPRSELRVVDVWDVVGLRGTASNDLVVDDAEVPAHRVLSNYRQAQLRGPGQQVNTGPLYRLPFAAVFTHAIASPLLGIVSGCWERYVETMRERTRLSLGGDRFAEDPYAQVSLARAASEIDAGVLQVERNLRELGECAASGREIPLELRLRTRRDQVRATERATYAVDELFRTAGGMSLHRGHPIERAWRDAHAGSVHVANDPERALAMYGQGAFGLSVEDNLV
ncbi:3-hydroxy-9,10-secoandrosta-1,3,5(10)-triene-9,17-dione monooxygenase oxygenase subunit [Streptomyces xiaopingdaonensis]|uniref:3-hydroxy-9,10-secoandrosta-1,3,5(10)-triene-9, 17-dione monooxygenase oxygenase subunit n=1 Tax=Streptomyces xiaopingdaonensis TaxID=1565415 RepID=UPI0002EFE3E5|nr:3-hydroxy-9,10-secoandrosta-1,3,5(10)-triene-9,17-dione monooxygenase oxygenase subunit [Streptomyces xiaopingdaonensis]